MKADQEYRESDACAEVKQSIKAALRIGVTPATLDVALTEAVEEWEAERAYQVKGARG